MSKKLMEVIMGLDVSIFMRGNCLCICISIHRFKSLLGMYLYLEIHMNVMSKKSVKVIPGLDVSNFFSGRESTCLSYLRGFPCGYDFILS